MRGIERLCAVDDICQTVEHAPCDLSGAKQHYRAHERALRAVMTSLILFYQAR